MRKAGKPIADAVARNAPNSSSNLISKREPRRSSSKQPVRAPIETGIDLRRFELNPVTKAYEIDGKPILWQYWDSGEHIPLVIRLWVEAMQCRNTEFRVILVHDSTLRHYLPKNSTSRGIDSNVYREITKPIFSASTSCTNTAAPTRTWIRFRWTSSTRGINN